jgi:cell division septal protein FtsQ
MAGHGILRGVMEIKTSRSREVQSSGIIPPPDRARHRKRTAQKLGNGHVASRRFISALKTLGKLCAFLLIAALLCSICIYAYTSGVFNLRDVRVYGCKEVDPKQVEEVIRQDFPKNILRIDLRELKGRLEKITWVKHVEIRRVLPSDLIIYVQERTPLVILEMQNQLMIADEEGILLGRYDLKFGKLDVPVFRGVLGDDAETYPLYQEENTARIRQALIMLSEIASGSPQYVNNISEVDISDRNNLKIMLVDDNAEILLGEKDYLKRIRTLMKHMDQYQELKSQNNDIASIDMRFDGQIVYQPRRTSAIADAKADR